MVKGVSPTESGLQLFPMMGGLLVASIGSGQIVARWGRYKVFPVVGTALMTVGLFAMSHIGVTTGEPVIASYMAVFGFGLGLVMQVLVVSVQNAVSYEELGTATSGVTFFRSIGGSFGTAVFGAIFANVLLGNLATQLRVLGITHIPGGATQASTTRPSWPSCRRRSTTPCRWPSPTASTGCSCSACPSDCWPSASPGCSPRSNSASRYAPTSPARASSPPRDRTSLEELRLNLERIAAREHRVELYETLAQRAGLAIPPQSCWLLYRVADEPACTVDTVAARLRVDPGIIGPGIAGLEDADLVAATDGAVPADRRHLHLTTAGEAAVERLVDARRAGLTELLEGWDLDTNTEVVAMVRQLAHELMADDQKMLVAAGMHTGR